MEVNMKGVVTSCATKTKTIVSALKLVAQQVICRKWRHVWGRYSLTFLGICSAFLSQ